MASDPTKPLLRLRVGEPLIRNPGSPGGAPKPDKYTVAGQRATFGKIWTRLETVLKSDPNALELRRDPTALAPERLLVFELRGSIKSFVNAVKRIPGLEFVDEEELAGDAKDEAPTVYLLVPSAAALREMLSLWNNWQKGTKPKHGLTAFRDVFDTLRNLRTWGPSDRILQEDRDDLAEELNHNGSAKVEIELIFRHSEGAASSAEDLLISSISQIGGEVLSRARIPAIAYHALLVDLPEHATRDLVALNTASIANLDPIMHIRAQSIATAIETAELSEGKEVSAFSGVRKPPILALLDGVPVAAHPLLDGAVSVDDQFSLEALTPVLDRIHGTAMASLIVHGDRNFSQAPLNRMIHCVPLLGAHDQFPSNRLIVDLVYQAVIRMLSGVDATASDVLIINLSLGNRRKPFHNRMSAWARLIDRLSYDHGVLFVVSGGNHTGPLHFSDLTSFSEYENLTAQQRATSTIKAIGDHASERRLLAPAETVNGLTIGAANQDYVSDTDRLLARGRIDPYGVMVSANPTSGLGPGFAGSVKPDLLLPGSREHLRLRSSGPPLQLTHCDPGRPHGLRVAAPPRAGSESWEHFTCGTSAATAVAARTAHLIHNALEDEYGDAFSTIAKKQRAVLLKALLVHTATWPTDTAELIKAVLGPDDASKHSQQKDNIRRFLGYGVGDVEAAVACASDRATFWATGDLGRDTRRLIKIPVPHCVNGRPQFHALSATLAWFTPTLPGRQIY